MKFIWQTWTNTPSDGSLGHGILIYVRIPVKSATHSVFYRPRVPEFVDHLSEQSDALLDYLFS